MGRRRIRATELCTGEEEWHCSHHDSKYLLEYNPSIIFIILHDTVHIINNKIKHSRLTSPMWLISFCNLPNHHQGSKIASSCLTEVRLFCVSKHNTILLWTMMLKLEEWKKSCFTQLYIRAVPTSPPLQHWMYSCFWPQACNVNVTANGGGAVTWPLQSCE